MTTNTDGSRASGIHIDAIFDRLPPMADFVNGIRRALTRHFSLSQKDTELALKKALRYVPGQWQEALAPEFLEELTTRGRICGCRFRRPARSRGGRVTTTRANASRAKPSR
jgi:urocanate hydratase